MLYYPLDSWFIRTTACRERMIELNNTINWKPQSTGTGRFGKWLENLAGLEPEPQPLLGNAVADLAYRRRWRGEVCIGSVEELYSEIEKSVKAGLDGV